MTDRKKGRVLPDVLIVYIAMLVIVAVAPLALGPVHNVAARALAKYLVYILMAAVIFAACRIGKRPFIETCGFSKEALVRQVLLALPLFAVTSLVFLIIPMLLGIPKTMLLDRKITDPTALVLQIIHLMLFVGVVEELVFRGYLFQRLKAATSSGVWPVVITAVAFGLWHFPANQNILQVVLLTVYGLIFGFARLKIKNCTTLTVALAHGLHDTFILVLSCILL
jgi:membrane protease YdiL (CAAX protease family)